MAPPIKVQKKPVVLEAMQFVGNVQEVLSWIESGLATTDLSTALANLGVTIYPSTGTIVLKTADGDIQLAMGDWIIKDETGQFNTCKTRKFENVYQLIEEVPNN